MALAQHGHKQHEGAKDNDQEQPVETEQLAEAPTKFTTQGALPAVAPEGGNVETASDKAAYDSDPGKRSAELTAKHGVRPRDYSRVLDGSNSAELILREVMPQIAGWLNDRAEAQKLDTRLSIAELTTNFLAEGGITALKENLTTGLDGFYFAGVDTFMDRYAELKPWLHPSITKDKVASQSSTNEKGEQVTSITELTLVQAAWANATMYAAGKARLEKWLKRHNKDIDNLSQQQQVYWATTYYNAGEGYAEKKLASEGVGAADKKWNKADDWQKYHRNAAFNAKMRTSTFELTRDESMTNDQFKAVAPATQSAVAPEVALEIERLQSEVELAESSGDAKRAAQLGQQLEVLQGAQRNQLKG